MQKTVISYNEREIREGKGTKDDINAGYNLWIDIVDPNSMDLREIQEEFKLDTNAVAKIEQGSKKPHIRTLDNHNFTIFMDLEFNNIRRLETKPVYFFVGRGWLITIHSKEVDILTKGRLIFTERNKKILEAPIDALYYSILSSIVGSYEQILTAIELKVIET